MFHFMCAHPFVMCMWKKSEDQAVIYEETIGGLEDNELFAIIDTNAPLPVFTCYVTSV